MRCAAFLVMMVLGGIADAQVFTVDTIKERQPWYQHELYTFPKIRMTGHEDVAHRIHRDLCLDFLDVDIDTLRGPLFASVRGDSLQVPPRSPNLYSFTWSCRSSPPSLVTFELAGEWCGAYCEEFTTHYAYDLRSGARLKFDSLFTRAGWTVVNDTLMARWQKQLQARITRVNDSLQATGLSQDVRAYFEEERDLYHDCLNERLSTGHVYPADMDPQRDALRVRISRCSAHANRNVDELDPMWIELPYRWLSPYLRPEIRALFKP